MQKFIHAAEKNGQLAQNALNYLWKNPETACLEHWIWTRMPFPTMKTAL